MAIKAIILGAGQIAGGFDDPKTEMVLTHAHALTKNSNYDCLGFFDVDSLRLSAMGRKWNLPTFSSLDEVKRSGAELFIICTPDNTHSELLREIASWKPGAVVCEKPMTESYRESASIFELYKKNNIPLFVNFQRRFDESVNAIKTNYDNGTLGKVLTVSVKYSKGLRHNGSHALDLLYYFFGAPIGFAKFREVFDFTTIDPTVDGVLRYKDHIVHLQASNEKAYSVFEIDFLFEKGRFRFHHSGLRLEESVVKEDSVFPNYFELEPQESKDSKLKTALAKFYHDLFLHLTQKTPINSDLNAALACQKLAEDIIEAKL